MSVLASKICRITKDSEEVTEPKINDESEMQGQASVRDSEMNENQGKKRTITGLKLVCQQFYSLIVKRAIYTKRRYFLYGILALIPFIACISIQVNNLTHDPNYWLWACLLLNCVLD